MASQSRALFMGVEHSLSDQAWFDRAGDERSALAISQLLGVPEIIGRIVSNRGIDPADAEDFLSPTLKSKMPDPRCLIDMDKATERLVRAIEGQEKIAVFGDYDVDGATSSALLWRFFRALGIDIALYIPDRITEGYGPNIPAFEKLKARGASVVITVDCGASAHAPLKAAHEMGLDVIVADHHLADEEPPVTCAMINPNREDDTSGLGHLAAVGVTFLLVVALNRALRERGFYNEGRPEPECLQWLDLVALGTICDVVPLTGLNRAYVAQGLKVMRASGNQGVQALIRIAGITEPLNSYHAGFIIGPRINAGGRVGRAGMGAELLTSDDQFQAESLAYELDTLNSERQGLEAAVLEAAIAGLQEKYGSEMPPCIVLAGVGWHQGVIGIVASRLKERTRRPVVVIGLDEAGCGKGSGRSIAGVDLGRAIKAAKAKGLLIEGGGHAMAAGLSITASMIAGFQEFMNAKLAESVADAQAQHGLGVDGALSVGGASLALYDRVQQAGPFGSGNAEPRFVLPAAKIYQAKVVGDNHVSCFLQGADNARIRAIAFRVADKPLGEALLNAGWGLLHVAGHLRADSWQGQRRVQFFIEDAALSAQRT